ncbi:hypothetical protein GCM10011521_05960 [Arenimonas soli]|uniref:Uncharacterized protein n=1 Tax=Arenimonas soli TaxID=2269504 RepID=A0ABQ1HDC3_9GAMM|nr:hypothetical protein GCM10011521_05960 [Arenimonas soli]
MRWLTLSEAFPALPGPEFFADEEKTILTADRRAFLSFDSESNTGIILFVETGQWLIRSPIAFVDFAVYAHDAGLLLAEGEESTRWARACASRPAAGVRH